MRKIALTTRRDRGAVLGCKVLFLGYDEQQTALLGKVSERCSEVCHTRDRIDSLQGFDLSISYGYRHILDSRVVASGAVPIVNLHIGYLPFNRGAHPNFWSFYEGTPSGVSIHLIEEGIDRGAILYQRYVNFSSEEDTFAKTYARLRVEVENLFVENIDAILTRNYPSRPQRGEGSYHSAEDLPSEFRGWEARIEEELARLESIREKEKSRKFELIDTIESVRQGNNINWMNLLRLAFETSPQKAKKIVRRINSDDERIAKLFKELGE